jgi:sugar lactone lactonase YvrE
MRNATAISKARAAGPALAPARRFTLLPKFLLTPALVLAVSACAAEAARGDGEALQVTDSAGVRVVLDAAPDRPAPWTVVRVRDLMPPDSALVPVPWGVVAAPDADRIWAIDWVGDRVVAFDGSGAWVGAVGRPGEGPGEFRNPVAIALDPEGHVRIWDAGRGVLARWTAAGELVDEVRPPIGYWGPGLHVHGRGLVTVTAEGSGLVQDQRLVEVSDDDPPTVLHELRRESVMLELPCGSRPMPRVFAPDILWSARADTVYVLRGPDYRIDALVGGAPVASFRRPLEPWPVTEAMAVERAGVGQFRMVLRMCAVTPEQVAAGLGWEEAVSPVQGIAVDAEGRLWVSRASAALVPESADVLAPDGRYLGTVDLPGIPVAFPSPTTVVLLSYRPETELPVLTLYELHSGAE